MSDKEMDVSPTPSLPQELFNLSLLIDTKLESFSHGDQEIRDVALTATKYIFDLALKSEKHAQPHLLELLQSIAPSEAPVTRAQTRAGLTSNPPDVDRSILISTPLSALYVTDMEDDQIWTQMQLKAENVCRTLEDAFDAGDIDAREMLELDSDADEDDDEDMELAEENDALEESDSEDGGKEDEYFEDEDEEVSDLESMENDVDNAEYIGEKEDEEDDRGEEAMEDDVSSFPFVSSTETPPRRKLKKRHPDLDDDFFDLEEFNAETEEAESKRVSRGALRKVDESDEDDMEDDVDFFAPIEGIEDTEELDDNANDLYYQDFFDPAKLSSSGKRKMPTTSDRSNGPRVHVEAKSDEDDDPDEIEQGRDAINRLKTDLFAEDENDSSKAEMSTHEARMASLRAQIAQLEADNVADKSWVLKGEVSAKNRPQNALLEEDLEFENVTKPVPIVTEEVVQSLESRIKARIIEGRFDDVARKQPLNDKPFLPSQVFELQGTKSKESLAQVYENEYIAAQSSFTMDDRDGKLQKEHDEIEKLWERLCYKLDALCNAHFTPKQPKASISTLSNVSSISLESALPTAKAASSLLAPEEVFAPNTLQLRSKNELTPAEKRASRTKERKKRQKQREATEKSTERFAKSKGVKSVKQQKEQALKSIVKTGRGVTVIGKKTSNLKLRGSSKS